MTKVYSKIDAYGNIFWYKEGTNILHREDGPAVELYYGGKMWYQNGKRHREDGPAKEWNNGDKEYWLNGRFYPDIKTDKEWLIYLIIN